MELSIVKAIPDYVIKALCTTLIHSLWQGLILSALAGVIIVGTRKASPARRYNLLIAALVVFTCTIAFTFVHQVQQEKAYHVVLVGQVNPVVNNIVYNNATQPQASVLSNNERFFSFLNDHSYTIVLVWFLIVFARSLQLMTGLTGLYHLRRRSIFAVDEAWENRVKELAESLGIKQIVRIAESGIAKVPMVIGHLKPLILIPVGLMTALSTAEIEAILVHELAHIRRKDYLVNLLVSLMEIIFFFNPAVLWISSLIKTERENCCDDIAVAQTSSKVNYIRALVSCQEYQLSAPAYAMAMSGHRNHLMGRVTRMVSNNNQSLNKMEKSLLAVCLVMAGLLTTAFSNADKINKLVDTTEKAVKHIIKKEPVEPIAHLDSLAAIKPLKMVTTVKTVTTTTVTDTDKKVGVDTASTKLTIYKPEQVGEGTDLVLPNGNLKTYLVKDNDVLYQLTTDGKTIKSMQVNGKTVSPDQYNTYLVAIGQAKLKSRVPVAPVAPVAVVAQQPTPISPIKEVAEPAQPADAINGLNVDLKGLKVKSNVDLAKLTVEQRNIYLAKLDALNQKEGTLNTQKQGLSYQQQALAYNADANYKPQGAYKPGASKYQPYNAKKNDADRAALTEDLIKQGIIKNKDELASFKLSNTDFIVNDKPIPDDVYQKFKEKYVPVKGKGTWSWMYNYNTTTTTK